MYKRQIGNSPFLEAVASIIHCLDNEVFDDYEIDLYATDFQYELLSAIARESEYCKNIRLFSMESLLPKEKLFERIFDIGRQNNITVDQGENAKVYFSGGMHIVLPKKGFVNTDTPCADIGVFKENEVIPVTIRTPLIISDSFGILQKSGHTCYSIPSVKLNSFWEFYALEFIERPVIIEYMTALRYVNFNQKQMAEFNAIKNNKPAYYINDIPSMIDKEETFDIDFACFPEDAFSLKIENTDIVNCQENTIFAINPGTTLICIYNDKGECAASKSITVVGHQYVENIRLIPRFEY